MEKAITKAQFNDASDKVVNEMINDERLKGGAKLMVPLIGSIFADKMGDILFGNDEEEK